MFLPPNVLYCIRQLEAAGYQAYAVGGCVRDSLLGLTPSDYDLCTDAKPEEICRVFADHPLLRHGQKHGTIGVLLEEQVYEITTFRTEGNYQDSRHPEWVDFVSDVKEDLARRDFTVNAMAYNPKTGYVDPFGGQQDLQDKVLRTVGDPRDRFREDALRILRGARFSSRFQLTPEPATMQTMIQMAPTMETLARERVFSELCKLLLTATAEDLLIFSPLLTQAIPELSPCIAFRQHSRHHRYSVFTHIAYVTENTPAILPLRWAALLHDIGKPAAFTLDEAGQGHFMGHAHIGADLANSVLLRLKAPTALRQQVTELVRQHMTIPEPDKKWIRRRIGKLGAETFRLLLYLQEADLNSKGVPSPRRIQRFQTMHQLLLEIQAEDACFNIKDLAVNGRDLQQIGFRPGPLIGRCLQHLLAQVQDEVIPNEQQTLLAAAGKYLEEQI